MSYTIRCSFCGELFDRQEHPVLATVTFDCCVECWHRIQDYLTERGFSIVGKGATGAQGKVNEMSMNPCGICGGVHTPGACPLGGTPAL